MCQNLHLTRDETWFKQNGDIEEKVIAQPIRFPLPASHTGQPEKLVIPQRYEWSGCHAFYIYRRHVTTLGGRDTEHQGKRGAEAQRRIADQERGNVLVQFGTFDYNTNTKTRT